MCIRDSHGGIVEVEGEKVGVYKDDQGQIFVISPKCLSLIHIYYYV